MLLRFWLPPTAALGNRLSVAWVYGCSGHVARVDDRQLYGRLIRSIPIVKFGASILRQWQACDGQLRALDVVARYLPLGKQASEPVPN